MSDHIGKNEKTKIVAKLATKGAGAPVREPMMSKDEQKDMMQYYYKKQEEFKVLSLLLLCVQSHLVLALFPCRNCKQTKTTHTSTQNGLIHSP